MMIYSIRKSSFGEVEKIRSKADVKTFLEKTFRGRTFLKVEEWKGFEIEVRVVEGEPLISVSVKTGNLNDVFNPLLMLDEADAINELFKYRKIINSVILGG